VQVKLQIPLVLSLRVGIKVKHLCLWQGGATNKARRSSKHVPAEMLTCPDASFFEVPAGYTERSLDDWVAREQDKMRNRTRHGAAHPEGSACTTPVAEQGGLDRGKEEWLQ